MIAYGRGTHMSGRCFISVLLALSAGCAGTDTPPRSDQLDRDIQAAYGDGGAAGASMASGGAAGSDMGAGGAGMAAGGSSMIAAGGRGGAGASGGSSSSGGGAVCNAPATVLTPSCGMAGCHGAGSPQGDFGASEAAARALVDEPSASGVACGLFIDSGSPEDSLILTKADDSFDKTNCVPQRMPLIGDFLDSEQLDCLKDWLGQFAE
jgi:hypothetical protein